MQKYFKKGRVVFALLFFVSILIAFSDIKGGLPSWYNKTVLYLQFIPSVLKTIGPGAVFSAGFIVILVVTILAGRIYCSAICPLGILQDFVIFIKKKVKPKQRLKFKKAFNRLRYSVLFISLASLFFSGIVLINLLDPYANFGRISSHIFQPVFLSVNNLLSKIVPSVGLHTLEARPLHLFSFSFGLGMLLLVVVMSWMQGRLYCNTVCPVGSFLGLLSKISVFKMGIKQSSCTRCGKCQAVCKSNCINIKTMQVDESRCVNCFNCITVCNDKSIGYQKIKKKEKLHTEPLMDMERRLFLTLTAGYLASKAVPVKAQYGAGKHRRKRNQVKYSEKGTVAPPGAKSIKHLKSKCVGCHLCVSVCPTKVLQPSFLEYGFTGLMLPKMDYNVHFCNYECTKCGEVCPTGAITHLSREEKVVAQIGKVQFVKHHCIVETEGTACGSCSEHCPTQAVKMVPYRDGLTIPEIDQKICIGCGACEYACPVLVPHKAIYVSTNEEHLVAEKPKSEKIEYEETEEFPF